MKASGRTMAGIMAAAMTLTIYSCSNSGSGNGNSPDKQDSQSVQQTLDKAYSAIEIEDIPLKNIYAISRLGDSGEFLVTGNADGDTKIYVADSEFSEFTPIDFSLDKSGNKEGYFSAYPVSDGTIAVRSEITDYGDFEVPDWEDPDFDYENFDFDSFRAAAKTTYSISILDRQGNILSENEITGLEKYKTEDENEDNYFYLGDMVPCGENFLIRIGSSDGDCYVTIGTDGVLGDKVDLGDEVWLDNFGEDSNGNFVYTMWEDGKNVLKTLDPDTMKLSDEDISLEALDNGYLNGNFIKGTGDYLVYASTGNGLIGLKSDGTADEIINWMDSDIVGQYVRNIAALDNGDFLIVHNNWNDNSTKVYRMTKADPSEFSSVKLINLVTMYGGTELLDKVSEFNRENTEYRIRVEEYGKYDEYDRETERMTNSAEKQLKLDIASGKTFDIYCFDSYDSSLFRNLSGKGMFADLYQFMGSNETVSKEDILPNILTLCEDDGKLTSLPVSFSFETMVVKKKFADKESWTIDEMAEIYEGLSDKMSFINYADSKTGTFYNLYDPMSGIFTDTKKGTSSFDSPEFVKLLEFCNGLDLPTDDPDWKTMTEEEMMEHHQNISVACYNDKALTTYSYIGNAREFLRKKYGEFGEDISLIGYPSVPGNGGIIDLYSTYAIFENSPHKEVCWDFISGFFDKDSYADSYFFPVVKAAFEKQLDETMEDPYYIDNDGKKHTYKSTYYLSESQPDIEIPNLNKDERAMLEDYISGITTVNANNRSIREIVTEEADAFFHGERASAQATADMIQSRVSIVVSEQS